MGIRSEFLEAVPILRELVVLAGPRWTDDSALEKMTVGALAGHAGRAATLADHYLVKPEPLLTDVLDAAGYYLSIPGLEDGIDSDINRSVRSRADAEATSGEQAVVEGIDAAVGRIEIALGEQSPDRAIEVLGGRAMLLDDYLVTRMVEVVVHSDDLAASLDLSPPEFAPAAFARVIDCLVEIARRRHGPGAVVRALMRRERDDVRALRVL